FIAIPVFPDRRVAQMLSWSLSRSTSRPFLARNVIVPVLISSPTLSASTSYRRAVASRATPPHQDISHWVTFSTPLVTWALAADAINRDSPRARDHGFFTIIPPVLCRVGRVFEAHRYVVLTLRVRGCLTRSVRTTVKIGGPRRLDPPYETWIDAIKRPFIPSQSRSP